jgi:hemoglobin
MKKDIKTRADIELLVNSFYDKVKNDDVIGYIFTDIIKVNWANHLPVMYNFWENVLFYTGGYDGNPVEIHKHLHRVTPLHTEHFKQWEKLFTGTIDELFEGEKATLAKQRAISISTVMQIKIAEEPGLAVNIYNKN